MPTHHGLGDLKGLAAFCHRGHAAQRGDRFGRIFHLLAPLYVNPELISQVGAKGGPLDGGSSTAADRTQTVDVGLIFFGQFVDHDITLDTTTSLSRNAGADEVQNVRTPTLDLDCVYGSGPEASPYLYHGEGGFRNIKLLTGAAAPGATIEQQSDLARSQHGTAIIGDPRNDENRVVSQLQLAMIRLHNKVVDELSPKYSGHELFEEARRAVTWHYQWVVVHDFLKKLCGKAVVDRILGQGRKHYCPSAEPFIPVEFSAAAYRFGHSMIPQKIQVQKGGSSFELFGSQLGLGFSALANSDSAVDWEELLDNGIGRSVQKSEKLDLKMASDLLDLPFITDGESSLATRNILRGQIFLLPSGEEIATAMDRPESEVDSVSARVRALHPGAFETGSPLWLYLLAEAEVVGRETSPQSFDPGEGLGPVGATIVAETMIGLIELDEESWLGQNRNWTPDRGENGLGLTTVGKLLTYAGPVPALGTP